MPFTRSVLVGYYYSCYLSDGYYSGCFCLLQRLADLPDELLVLLSPADSELASPLGEQAFDQQVAPDGVCPVQKRLQ